MSWVRAFALALSIAVHAGLLFFWLDRPGSDALAQGQGEDDLNVVATVTIENGDLLGTDTETAPAQEAAMAAAPASPMQQPEEKKPEEADIKAAEPPSPPTPEPAENKIAETEQPPAPVAPPEPVHDTAQEVASAAAEAQKEREAAERTLQARRATLTSLYQGEIYSSVEHHKVNPRSRRTGRVVVELTIDASGKLVSREVVQSSGSEILDRAAVATLDRAAPFPPIPADLGSAPRTFRVPFEYATR